LERSGAERRLKREERRGREVRDEEKRVETERDREDSPRKEQASFKPFATPISSTLSLIPTFLYTSNLSDNLNSSSHSTAMFRILLIPTEFN